MISWPESLNDENRSQASEAWLADLVIEEITAVVSRHVAPSSPLGNGSMESVFEEILDLLARPAIAFRLESLVRLAAYVALSPFEADGAQNTHGIPVVSRTNQGCRARLDPTPSFFDFGAAAAAESLRQLPVGCVLETISDLMPMRFEVDEDESPSMSAGVGRRSDTRRAVRESL